MDEVAATSFAARLKRYRVATDLTQEGLAERAGLSVRAISDLERGVKQRPYPHTVRRLIQALGLDEEAAERFEAATRRPAAGTIEAEESAKQAGGRLSLPIPPTSFIGREREIEEVKSLLDRQEVHLLTLTGPGGAGKTRLALRVAEEVADFFPEGVVFVSLAPLADPGLVPSTIARSLNVEEPSHQPILKILIAHLQGKRLLLVVDNFEHLLPAADVLSALLVSCPQLTILITSRAVLHRAAEHEYPVPPLSFPAHLPALDSLSRYDAVQLFLQRARAVKPRFTLTEENAAAIAEICWRLDGLPLAIELAAVHIRLFSPSALLTRLSDPLRLLTGGPRDVPIKQQTMRATIEWSYSLLSEQERSVLARLSVFAGGGTFQAAEALCDEADYRQGEVLLALESLVDQSLLGVEEADGEPRFRMLETVREYALERLAASGETEHARRRHAEVFLRLAEEAEQEGGDASDAAWLARLQREHDNLRGALAWSLQAGRVDRAIRLAGALAWFWEERAYHAEGRQLLEQSLALLASSDPSDPPGVSSVRAKALSGIGRLAHRQGDLAAARSYAERGVAMWRELGDGRRLASALWTVGWVSLLQGDHARGRSSFEEIMVLSHHVGAVRRRLLALEGLGHAERQQGRLAAARDHFAAALALARTCQPTLSVADQIFQLINLAHTAWAQDDSPALRGFYDQALTLSRSLTDPAEVLGLSGALALIACCLAEYDQAAEFLPRTALIARGDVARCRDDAAGARTLYEESLALARKYGDRYGVAAASHNLGHVVLVEGDARRAGELFAEGLGLFRELRVAWGMADCLMGLAGVVGQTGPPDRAAILYGAADAAHHALDASGAWAGPANRISQQREMAAARAGIDEETWSRAYQRGRAMTLEQAMEHAVEKTGRIRRV